MSEELTNNTTVIIKALAYINSSRFTCRAWGLVNAIFYALENTLVDRVKGAQGTADSPD